MDGIVKCTEVKDGSFLERQDKAGMGFFHRHDFKGDIPDRPDKKKPSFRDWDTVLQMSLTAPRRHLDTLSQLFGCTSHHLAEWGVGYLYGKAVRAVGTRCNTFGCWTFPMKDAQEKTVGFRLRNEYHSKYALSGSSNGLFFKGPLTPNSPVLVVDGVSDAITGWLHGLNVVGRPSSTSGNELLTELLTNLNAHSVWQLLDRDKGKTKEHARDVARELMSNFKSGKIFYPPGNYKDLREWLRTQKSLPNKLSKLAITCGKTKKSYPAITDTRHLRER